MCFNFAQLLLNVQVCARMTKEIFMGYYFGFGIHMYFRVCRRVIYKQDFSTSLYVPKDNSD